MHLRIRSRLVLAATLLVAASQAYAIEIGDEVALKDRRGQEIVVCGRYFHVGTPVVLWTDPGGYDLRRRPSTRRASTTTTTATATTTAAAATTTAPAATSTTSPNLMVDARLAARRLRGGTIPFDELRLNVDQFVLHYDVAGTAEVCYRVLKRRGLGVQFMLDLDGTVYQAMDLRDSAAHATIANTRSIGVEIANMGAYTAEGPLPRALDEWYKTDARGDARIVIPERLGTGGIRTPGFVGKPARPQPVIGNVQGKVKRQFDFTREQYNGLAQLTAGLCTVFPKIQPDYPRQLTRLGQPTTGPTTSPVDGDPTTQPAALADPDQPGVLISHTLTRAQFDRFQGILGHYHVQLNKDDPGPAFQWIPFTRRVRSLMTADGLAENKRHRDQPAATRAAIQPTNPPATQPVVQPAHRPVP